VTDEVSHFDTVTIDAKASGLSADKVISEFHKYGINLRKIDDSLVGVSFNETTNLVDLDELIEIFSGLKSKATPSSLNSDSYYQNKKVADLPANLKRTSSFMTQP
jgi:glycine dehydrogenase